MILKYNKFWEGLCFGACKTSWSSEQPSTWTARTCDVSRMVGCGFMTAPFVFCLQAWDILSSAAITDLKAVGSRNLDIESHPHAQVKLGLRDMSRYVNGEIGTRTDTIVCSIAIPHT